MTATRLPDGFAVQVDRRVRVLGDGSALLGGSPTGCCGWLPPHEACSVTAALRSATRSARSWPASCWTPRWRIHGRRVGRHIVTSPSLYQYGTTHLVCGVW